MIWSPLWFLYVYTTHNSLWLQSSISSIELAARQTYLWGEIPQHQPAAGPVGAVSAPGGSLWKDMKDIVKYNVQCFIKNHQIKSKIVELQCFSFYFIRSELKESWFKCKNLRHMQYETDRIEL